MILSFTQVQKMFPPFRTWNGHQKTLFINSSFYFFIHSTSGHDYYSYPCHPQELSSSAPTYCLTLWYLPPHSGTYLSLMAPVPPTYPLIYPYHNTNSKTHRNTNLFQTWDILQKRISFNIQKSTLFYLGNIWYWLIYLKAYFLFRTYIKNRNRNCIFILPISKLNWELLL